MAPAPGSRSARCWRLPCSAPGEWLRRKGTPGLVALPFADVPAMLTAAGTSTAYAVIYAAYELYDLLPPGVAFLLLGAVAIGSMVAALLHGPMLAALGLVAAGVAPLLVSTDEPSAWGLAVYIAVVAAAAIGVARARLWAWLAALAIVGTILWGLVLLVLTDGSGDAAAPGFLAAALMALTGGLLVPGLFRGPPAGEAPRPDWVSALAVAGALGLAALLTVAVDQATPSLILFAVLAFAAVAMAWRAEAASHAPLIARAGQCLRAGRLGCAGARRHHGGAAGRHGRRRRRSAGAGARWLHRLRRRASARCSVCPASSVPAARNACCRRSPGAPRR